MGVLIRDTLPRAQGGGRVAEQTQPASGVSYMKLEKSR